MAWWNFAIGDRPEGYNSAAPELYHSLEGDKTCDERGPSLPCRMSLRQAGEREDKEILGIRIKF